VLLVAIVSYLKSVLRHKFLILDTNHPDNLYEREQGYEDPWLFVKSKGGPRANKFWKTFSWMNSGTADVNKTEKVASLLISLLFTRLTKTKIRRERETA